MQARLRGPERDAQGCRHVGQRHAHEVVQDDDGPPLGVEAPQRVIEQLPDRRWRWLMSAVDGPWMGESSTSTARRRRRRVMSIQEWTTRLAKPGIEAIGIAKTGQVAPGADETLLDRVACELRVAEDQPGCRVQPRDGRADEHREGVMIASLRPVDEVSLVHGCLRSSARPQRSCSDGMAFVTRESFPGRGPIVRGVTEDPGRPGGVQAMDPAAPVRRRRLPAALDRPDDLGARRPGDADRPAPGRRAGPRRRGGGHGLPDGRRRAAASAVLTAGRGLARSDPAPPAADDPGRPRSRPARREHPAGVRPRVADPGPALRRRVPERLAGGRRSTCRGTRCSWRSPERERYVEAMALLNGSRSLAYVAGPTVGGLLVQVLGAPLAMLADAVSYLGSVVFLRRIESPEPPVEHEQGTLRERLFAGSHSSSATRSCDRRCSPCRRSTCSTSRSPRCSSCTRRRPWASSRVCSGWRSGRAPIGGVVGAVVAVRIGRRIGLGPAYALGAWYSRCRSC